MSGVHDLVQGRFLGKANDLEVAAMSSHDQGSRFFERLPVIGQAHFIGRSHFDKLCTGLLHHIRDAESAAYLDQLGARDNDTLFVCQGCQDKQHRRGIIVDHQGRLGTGQFLQDRFSMHQP